jgi:hypothetical protein
MIEELIAAFIVYFKIQKIYLRNYGTKQESDSNIPSCFHFFNAESLHQLLNYKTPTEVYFKRNDLQNIKIMQQANENIHLNLPWVLS